MKLRSEDDILSRAPITVRLGDRDYSIPLLPIIPQREWRKNLFSALAPLLESFNFQIDQKGMATSLTAALLRFPEKRAELVFDYRAYGALWDSLSDRRPGEQFTEFLRLLADDLVDVPDFPRGEILANATEEQIATAFSAIMAVAFPFFSQIVTVTEMMRTASLPQ